MSCPGLARDCRRKREKIRLTTSRLGQLRQFQDRVVWRVGLVAGVGVPRISDVGWAILPQVFGRVGGFVCCDHIDVQIFVLVEVGKRVDV